MHGLARGVTQSFLIGGMLAGLSAGLARPATADLDVVVTIKPLHALVAQVMAGAGTPELLVRGASSPHTYALRPSDAAKLNRADVLIRMSEIMEPFTVKIAQALPKSVQVVTLQDTPGLVLLPRRTGATFDRHEHHDDDDGKHAHKGGRKDHDHKGHKHKTHKHEDGHRHHARAEDKAKDGKDEDHDHAHGAIDGHAWLDPANAKLMAGRIAEVLAAKEPAKAALYRANAAKLASRLDALDAELKSALARAAGKPYVVFHDALQYFERRYGLNVVGSISMSPEVPPSAGRLSALRRRIAELGAVCVFAEPQFDTRLVANVIEGTDARTATIDPEGSRIDAGPNLYVTLLRTLARDLDACLARVG